MAYEINEYLMGGFEWCSPDHISHAIPVTAKKMAGAIHRFPGRIPYRSLYENSAGMG